MDRPPEPTCAGMLPGAGITEEERLARDLQYKPKRVRKAAEDLPYAEHFDHFTGEQIHPGDRVSFRLHPRGTARGVVEVNPRVRVRQVGKPDRQALAARTDAGELFDLPSKHLRLLK